MSSANTEGSASRPQSRSAGPLDHMSGIFIFARAAELLSFSETGRQLGISNSAVGKAIARLEGRLGLRLFHRSTRSIRLTPEGDMFLGRCQRILAELAEAESELATTRKTPSGRLRVSIPLVGTLLMPVIGAFMREYPDVQLDIDFSDRLVDVIEDGFDVVLRTGASEDSRLTSRLLGNYTHVIVAAAAYLAAHGVPALPEDLAEHACLQHRFSRSGKLREWRFSRDGVVWEIDLPSTAVASAVEPLIAMAEQGLGLACVPDFSVRSQLANGSLVTVLQPFCTDEIPFRAVWPSGRMTSPKARAFIDFVSQNLFPAHYFRQNLDAAISNTELREVSRQASTIRPD